MRLVWRFISPRPRKHKARRGRGGVGWLCDGFAYAERPLEMGLQTGAQSVGRIPASEGKKQPGSLIETAKLDDPSNGKQTCHTQELC